MGKNKKPAAEVVAAALPPGASASWFPSGRQRRKCGKCIFWLLIPLAAAAGLAYLAPPPPPEKSVGSFKQSSNIEDSDSVEEVGETPEAPPSDIWANPSECVAWSGSGQCKANPQFMLVNCAFSCAKLEYAKARYYKRCPIPDNYTAALAPGKMRGTFDRILRDFPELEPEEISHDPPVILFHKFFSESETAAFIRHGKGRYEKSLGVGIKEDGTMGDVKTEIRTSSHGWCQHSACLKDPDVQRVVARVSDVTQTPAANAEFAQLVYYHACADPDDPSCAFYRRHNDYIDGDEHRLQGVRIYTLFGYMNDVPEGGGTRFTSLPSGPVTFQPQRGKAILWPSVLADEPHNKDERTDHEALPVLRGEKFGANFWIHQYDFKAAHASGCTAS